MKFLIVDDSPTMLRIMKNIVERLGYSNNVYASNGLEAYIAFTENKFDMVITDWNMPEMNGLGLVKKIREKDTDIPIIMVTTEGGKVEVITALKAGVNNYIIKPFTPQILKEKIIDLL